MGNFFNKTQGKLRGTSAVLAPRRRSVINYVRQEVLLIVSTRSAALLA